MPEATKTRSPGMEITGTFFKSVPWYIELTYFGLIFYSILLSGGQLAVPMLGGGLNLLLAAYCLRHLGWGAISPIVFPLTCALSFILVQVVFHEESFTADYIHPFTIWMIQLVVVQTLALRKGFVHRFAIVAAVVGVFLLQYLTFLVEDLDVSRATVESSVGLANPNDLARWFGFLAVYFLTAGVATRRPILRYLWWVIAIGSLYVVSLTVSRGVLAAVLIAAVIAFRHLLYRGFLPLLAFSVIVFMAVGTGLFESGTQAYTARAAEETGRWLVWPLVLERFLDSPLIGVKVSDIGIYVPDRGIITPHNPFLFLASASGIVPLIFFIAYWVKAVKATIQARQQKLPETLFYETLLTYVAFAIIPENLMFTSHWAMVTMSVVLAPRLHLRMHSRATPTQEFVKTGRFSKSSVKIDPSFARFR